MRGISMKKETKLCKYCKTEIPGDAKICPQCRKKQGMGLLPKAAIVVVVLGIIGAVGGSGSNSDKTETVAESKMCIRDSTSPAQRQATHARPRINLSFGFPPFALLKCLQSGENHASATGCPPHTLTGSTCHTSSQ